MSAFESITDPWLADLVARWQKHLTVQDLAVVERAGYGRPILPGARPALILVDFQRAYLGEDVPILEQVRQWPSGGGAGAWAALRAVTPLVATMRDVGALIVHSRIAYPAAESAANPFVAKRGGGDAFVLGNPGTELALTRHDDEPLITKTAASLFYGTGVDVVLADHGIDTLVVCGLSTSGCVRATVVDGAARGYRVLTLADACADRISASHDLALFDIWLKYGSVVSTHAVIDHFARHPEQETRR